MKKSGKNFFYLDEQSSSEEYEDEFPSFSDPKVVGIKTMKQPRRNSACKGPVTLNPYAQAYIGQQHLDPGRSKIKISHIQILIDKIKTHGLTRYVVVSKMILLRQNNLLSLLLVQGCKGNLVSDIQNEQK